MSNSSPKDGIRIAAGYVAVICLAYLLWMGLNFALHHPHFDIRRIEVSGETEFIDVPALQESLRQRLRGNYFFADLDDLRHATEAVPWVENARVERIWPDALRVKSVRRRAAGRWGKDRLVSTRGEIFAPGAITVPEADGLPLFFGPDAMGPEVVEQWEELRPIAARLPAELVELRVTSRGAWSAIIESADIPRTRVELGRPIRDSRIAQRFALIVAHYGEVSRMLGGPPAAIDARYVGAFAAAQPDPARVQPQEQPNARQEDKSPDAAGGAAIHSRKQPST